MRGLSIGVVVGAFGGVCVWVEGIGVLVGGVSISVDRKGKRACWVRMLVWDKD